MLTRRRTNPAQYSQSEGSEEEEEEVEAEEEEEVEEVGRRGKRARAAARQPRAGLARRRAAQAAEVPPGQEPRLPGRNAVANSAALLEVLSVPALQRHFEQPAGEASRQPKAAAFAKDIASLATALGAPSDPGLQHLLASLWASLELPATAAGMPSWGADLPRTLEGFDLEAAPQPALKALCRAFGLRYSGSQEQLVVRDFPAALTTYCRLSRLCRLN